MAGVESPEKVAKPKPLTQWETLDSLGSQFDQLLGRHDRYEAAASNPTTSPPRTPQRRKRGQSACVWGGHVNVNDVVPWCFSRSRSKAIFAAGTPHTCSNMFRAF